MTRSWFTCVIFICSWLLIAGSILICPCTATPSIHSNRISSGVGAINLTSPICDDSATEFETSEDSIDLTFHGEFHHHEDLPIPRSLWSTPHFFNFFQARENRNHLLKGGSNPTEDHPLNAQVLEAWSARSQAVSSAPPIPFHLHPTQGTHHSVVEIHSTVPLIPGLFIKAVSIMGCRLLSHPDYFLPIYEFTLIEEHYHPQGKKPLVWLYNRVTGDGTSPLKEKNAPSWSIAGTGADEAGSRLTNGLFRMTLEPVGESLRFSYFSMVKVSCKLPKRLLKILPLSKQNMEAKISSSMAKQIQSEVMQSAEKFRSALEVWLS